MQQRRRISDNSTEGLILIGLLSIFAPSVFILIGRDYSLVTIISTCLFFWLMGLVWILSHLLNDQIEFDGAFFYIASWKGNLKVTVPVASISSLISSRVGFRLYYNAPEGKKKYVFFSPGTAFRYDKMVKHLKEANPYFFTSDLYFLKGFEFLIFKDEEWFK